MFHTKEQIYIVVNTQESRPGVYGTSTSLLFVIISCVKCTCLIIVCPSTAASLRTDGNNPEKIIAPPAAVTSALGCVPRLGKLLPALRVFSIP